MTKALCITVIIDSLGWIFGIIPPLYYTHIHRSFPVVWGIRLLDGGPFGRLGINTAILAGIIFIIISSLKLLAAYWLWNYRMDGAVLELILLGLKRDILVRICAPFLSAAWNSTSCAADTGLEQPALNDGIIITF